MKTSNIILVSLFGSVSVFILAIFVELRLNGIKRSDKPGEPSMEKQFSSVSLSNFKYLVINETTNLTITSSSSETALVVKIGTEDKDPIIQHHVSGDTLFIDKIAFGADAVTLTAELKLNPENLKWIKASQSAFSIFNTNIDGLTVDLYHSRFNLHSNQSTKIGSIKINSSNSSDFSASSVELQTVNITLDHSSAWMDATIHQVDAELKNESTLSAPQADNVNSHKDKSSRIN